MIAAIIPARGGSKRLPGKNLARIGGSTLVELAIKCAQEVEAIDIIAVSTDCQAIAAEAFRCGAVVIPRPAELATDDATSESVALHAASVLLRDRPLATDSVLLLQPTSPLRTPEDIRGLIRVHEQVMSRRSCFLTAHIDPCGAGYIMTTRDLNSGKLFSNGCMVHIDEDRAIDIDTAEDLARAQERWARRAVA